MAEREFIQGCAWITASNEVLMTPNGAGHYRLAEAYFKAHEEEAWSGIGHVHAVCFAKGWLRVAGDKRDISFQWSGPLTEGQKRIAMRWARTRTGTITTHSADEGFDPENYKRSDWASFDASDPSSRRGLANALRRKRASEFP